MVAQQTLSRLQSHQPSKLAAANFSTRTMAGKLLSQHYQIVQVLGAGGFSQTYLAEDIYRGNRTCVVKHFQPASSDSSFLQAAQRLFQREAQVLEKLGRHNQIPQLLAYFEDDKQDFYLVLEYTAGQPLSAEILPGYCWSESQVIELLQEVLELLVFIHSHGVIHRDIKPDNLIRRELDNQLVLIDFGSIKQIGTQGITPQAYRHVTIPIGTRGYMAAEQGQGNPRPSSDLYSLGIIAIQALMGLEPTQFERDEMGEICWQQQAKVSSELASVINKLVSYHFKDRYQSATEALDALQPLIKAQALNQLKFSLNQLGTSSQNPPIASSLQPLVSSSKLRQKFGFPKRPELPIGSGNLKWILPGLGTGIAVAAGLSVLVHGLSDTIAVNSNSALTNFVEIFLKENEPKSLTSTGTKEEGSESSPPVVVPSNKGKGQEIQKENPNTNYRDRNSRFRPSLGNAPSSHHVSSGNSPQPHQRFLNPRVTSVSYPPSQVATTKPRPKPARDKNNNIKDALPVNPSVDTKGQEEANYKRQLLQEQKDFIEQVQKRLEELLPDLESIKVASNKKEEIAAYQQNLEQYEEAFRAFVYQPNVSQEEAHQQLQNFRQKLGLSEESVKSIEEQVMIAYKEDRHEYEEAVRTALYIDSLSPEEVHQHLQSSRQELGLSEKTFQPIEEQVIAAYQQDLQQYAEDVRIALYIDGLRQEEVHQHLQPSRQNLGLSKKTVQPIEEQVIFVYQQDLQQYAEDVRIALYIDDLPQEEVHQHLQPSRQKLGLSEKTVQPIEEQIIVAYERDLQQYEEAVRIALYIDGLSPEEVHQHLQPLRQDSGLSEEIVQPIEEQVIVAYEQDLQQYQDAFELVLAQQDPFSEAYYQAVQELQQKFGLSATSVASIEEQVTIAYKHYQEAVAQILEKDGLLSDEIYQLRLQELQQESGLRDETFGLIEERVIATYKELEHGITTVITQITSPSDVVESPTYTPAETEENMESYSEANEAIGSHPLAESEQDIDSFSQPNEIIGSHPILATEDDLESYSEANEAIGSHPLTEMEQDVDSFSQPSQIIGSAPLTETKQNSQLEDTFTCPSDNNRSAIISPDGRFLVGISEDNKIKVWNCLTGDLLYALRGNSSKVQSVDISSDSQKLLSISADNTRKIWSLHTGELLTTNVDSESNQIF